MFANHTASIIKNAVARVLASRGDAGIAMDLNTLSLELDAQMFLRLLVAVVLGALVGYERERAGKPAGVRTHGMVSLGAALFAVV